MYSFLKHVLLGSLYEDQNLTAKEEMQNFCVLLSDLKSLKGSFLK